MDNKASEQYPTKTVILNSYKVSSMNDKNRDSRKEALKEVSEKLKDLKEEIDRKQNRIAKWKKTMHENIKEMRDQKRIYEYDLEQLKKYSVGSTGNPIEDEQQIEKKISSISELISKTKQEMLKENNRMEETLDKLLTQFRRAERRKQRLEKLL